MISNINLCEFINSRTIQTYLQEINYCFSSLEVSWIIYQSRKKSIYEKIEAWEWLISNMEDCEVPERINCLYRPSLHQALREYIDDVNAVLQSDTPDLSRLFDRNWEFFEGMWFSFPVPFVKGDIVVRFDKNDGNIYWGEEGPMVMEGNVFLNDLHKEAPNGDSTDMIAWGYFLDEDGNTFSEVAWNYMDLEYYCNANDHRYDTLMKISECLKSNCDVAI